MKKQLKMANRTISAGIKMNEKNDKI